MVSVGPHECPGALKSPSGNRCFTEAARDQAAAADVVVVNTHLYGAHLASGGSVLPEHDVVVFDETHQLEEVMTSALGVEITPGRFRALVTSARPLVPRPMPTTSVAWRVPETSWASCWPTGWAPASCANRPNRMSTIARWPTSWPDAPS